jgi:transcriptional regulator with PAS, ATPase and Fis domain
VRFRNARCGQLVRPVKSVNVRLVASTNRDPEAAVRSHILREDLYYRVQANVLRVPALRERLDDVPLLVEYFIALFNEPLAETSLPSVSTSKRSTLCRNTSGRIMFAIES